MAHIIEDYETEMKNLMQEVECDFQILHKNLDSIYQELVENDQLDGDIASMKVEIPEIAKKIVSAREDADAVRNDRDRVEREKQRLIQDYDQLNILISERIHERDNTKEVLAQVERRLEEKKRQVELEELSQREKIINVEKGMLLYQTHLGLKIQKTNHNTLVLIFTQIDRSDPEKEHMLELTLQENNYHLVTSDPPLPNLRELEERLNASNNLSGCFVHVRKLFQKMHE